MTYERIVGLYFFEDNNRWTVTVAGDFLSKYIQEYLLPEMEDLDMHKMWFQQDGTPVHTTKVTIEMLKTISPKSIYFTFWWCSFCTLIPWFNRLDLFLWGYLKINIYIDGGTEREYNSINPQPNYWYFKKSHGNCCPKNAFVPEQ